MKKLFLTCALIVTFSLSNAQTISGFKGGLNIAKFHAKAEGVSITTDDLFTFHLGVYFDNNLSEKLNFMAEVLLSQQGGESDGIKQELFYINVLLLLKYAATPEFGIYAGPQIGYLAESNQINGIKVKDFYNEIDVSLAFGGEFYINENFKFGGRYNLGVINILEDNNFGGTEVTVTNRVIQVYIGINF